MKKWIDDFFEEHGDVLGMLLLLTIMALFFKGCELIDKL